MYVSSYKTVNLNVQSLENRADDQAAAEDQKGSLSDSLVTTKHLDVGLTVNTDKYSNTGKNSDSTSVFDQLLSHAYRKLSEQFAVSSETEAKMSEVKGYNDGQPITAEKASHNILGFIERRIMLDKADGASQAQLESRLAAGLEGFEKGFAQAKEQLEALSLLSPSIAADIEQTYDLVHSGLEILKEKYLSPVEINSKDNFNNTSKDPSDNVGAQNTPQYLVSREIESRGDNNNTLGLTAPVLDSSFDAANSILAQRNSFSFELKTLEGDTVSIRASAQEHNMSNYSYGQKSSFDLQVIGELDSGELKAINELLSQVHTLSDTFYSGDMGKAFEQALNVGYNSEEIAQFALTLTHSKVQKIQNAYQEETPETSFVQRLEPISRFVEQVMTAVDTARHFGNSIELIQQLVVQLEDFSLRENTSARTDDSSPNFYPIEQAGDGVVKSDKSTITLLEFMSITIRSNNEKTA